MNACDIIIYIMIGDFVKESKEFFFFQFFSFFFREHFQFFWLVGGKF
jgi:hypothetical protein